MRNWLKRALSTLLALCMIVGVMPAALAADRSELEGYADWARKALLYFADNKYMVGDAEGYRPDDDITRVEFMVLLNRVCGFTEKDEEKAAAFTDISDDWIHDAVSIALKAGYVRGRTATTMAPSDKITRQEAFLMVARIAGLTSDDTSILKDYADADQLWTEAKPAAAALVADGHVKGYNENGVSKLKPNTNIRRAEAVVVLYRMLSVLQPADPEPTPTPTPTPSTEPTPSPSTKPEPTPEPETDTYVLMNIPYSEFYAADVNNSVAVDAVASATKNKTRSTLVGGSYHVNADGTDITGITFPVKVDRSVDLSKYTKITDDSSVSITMTMRGKTTTTEYKGQQALFESASYSYYVLSEAPKYYKEVTADKDGKLTFGKLQGEAQALDVTAELTTDTKYGDYQLDVDLQKDTINAMGSVYGVILSTDEADYGLRHLENVWRTTELAWCTGFTKSSHGSPTSSAHYEAMMGQTIKKITYITAGGIYTINANLYVPIKFDGKLEVADKIDTDTTTEVPVTLTSFPEGYEPVYTVRDAKRNEVTSITVADGKLTFAGAAVGKYTLTVSDGKGKYAPVSATFELQTANIPVTASTDTLSLVNAQGGSDGVAAYVANITSVKVGETTYNATGRDAVALFNENGALDLLTAPFKDMAAGKTYSISIAATGYSKTLDYTVTIPDTIYAYASMTYAEYWAAEGVYKATSTESSTEVDRETTQGGKTYQEHDKGGFDAVTRATSNHGLHRGSFQQDVVIHTADKDYYPLYWTDGDNFVDAKDGRTYNKKSIGITSYDITGIKYVPVSVSANDLQALAASHTVTLNGQTLAGGYTENALKAYTYTANVTANTNGLKAATLSDGVWSFGARQTGTESGLLGKDLTAFDSAITQGVKEYSGSFGEFLRFDITGNYGDLGGSMQTVKWTYYGDDSTYTKPLQTYGTKFAADNWMHKSMGIQLGLTDSVRCQLPEGTDGTGYWTVTIYALGYADYTAKIQVTKDNLPKDATPITDEQKTKLTELIAQAQALVDQGASNSDALKEHIAEAQAMLAAADAAKADAEELIGDLTNLIAAGQPKDGTYTGTALVETDDPGNWNSYNITATVAMANGKITEITVAHDSTNRKNGPYVEDAKDGLLSKLTGKSKADLDSFADTVSGATISSKALVTAVKDAVAKAS